MDRSNLVFLDTETTGIGAEDKICQVAYKFKGVEYNALFKPEIPISVEAMSVAHITNRMVADKESFVGSGMYTDLQTIFKEDNILVAHNAQFDAQMLAKEGITIEKKIDTFKIAHNLDAEGVIPRYNLQYLRYYLDFEITDAPAHDALGDIRVLEVIFDYYFQEFLKVEDDANKVIEKMLLISSLPVLMKKFNFGKYNGEKVNEVAQKDSGYLKWLLGEKVKSREKGEENDSDWIYTLEYYLRGKATLF